MQDGVDGTADDTAAPSSTLSPASPAFITTRRLILLSFWVVVVAFGLPHWVWTTSVHRSDLPAESMLKWSGGEACQLHYPIHIALEGATISLEQLTSIAIRTEVLFPAQAEGSLYSYHVAAKGVNKTVAEDTTITVRFSQEDSAEKLSSVLRSWEAVLDVSHGPVTSAADDQIAVYLAQELEQIFEEEHLSIAHLLHGSSFQKADRTSLLNQQKAQALDKRTTRAFKYASTYHLTFSLFVSSTTPSSWDIEAALAEYIEPLIKSLSAVSDFTIDTQIQLYASFSPSISGPHYNSATDTWHLLPTDLSGFVNAAEWPLSPSIGSGPTINLVVYIPSPSQSPLLLSDGGTSWIIPQWGGVQIFNPANTSSQPDRLDTRDLEPIMQTFASQLLTLLKVPGSPPSSLALQIASLQRERTTSLVLSASSTLGALVRLTQKLQSIAIPHSVATSVSLTLDNLEQACTNLGKGRFAQALEHTRIAETEAEKAFFEPSMVGQVYFPEEHKVAVYVPLLGPMAVPLIMSLIKEVREWRARGKVKTS